MRSGQLGSVPAPAASRAREFNPGHAPHHRGIGVTPPGLGREKLWGDLGGWCAPRDGVAPHSGPQLAPRGVRGEMLPVLSGGRRLPFPGGLGASSLLTGILQAWRGCLTAGILQAWRGACCLKTGKEQAPGPFPGARPARSLDRFPPRPIPAARPGANAAVWRCDRHGDRGQLPGVDPGRGPRPRAAWSSREGSRHGSSAGISAVWSDGRRGFRLSRGP